MECNYKTKKSWGKLILASSSPRRFDLLKSLEIPFKTTSISVEENFLKNETPVENACRLAAKKAEAAMEKFPDDLILSADTIVAVGQQILGKPLNPEEAIRMLTVLSGREHEVITAIALFHKRNKLKNISHVVTKVKMKSFGQDEILEYVNKGESLDKAGAYAMQGEGSLLVESYTGCYDNIVGLPVSALNKKLALIGFFC